jgi:methyl-accepting chemotaxis protein
MKSTRLRFAKLLPSANTRLPLAISGRLLTVFGLGLAIFIALSVVSYTDVQQLADATSWVRHTHEVLKTIQRVNSDLLGLETAAQRFVITGRENLLTPYPDSVRELHDDERTLRRLTADNPRQQTRVTSLENLIDQRLALSQKGLDAYRRGGLAAVEALVSTGSGKEIIEALGLVLGALEREERELLTQREAQAQASGAKTYFILGIGTFIGLGLLLALLFFINSEAAGGRKA